jgi:hypothetical protein
MFPLIGAVLAIIFARMARNEIERSQGRVGGDGLAKAGSILGWAQIIITVVVFCGVIVIIGVLTVMGGQVEGSLLNLLANLV